MASLVQRAFELKTITDAQRRYLFIQLAQAGYPHRKEYQHESRIIALTAWSNKPTEHTAPASTAIRAVARRTPSNPRSGFCGLGGGVISAACGPTRQTGWAGL